LLDVSVPIGAANDAENIVINSGVVLARDGGPGVSTSILGQDLGLDDIAEGRDTLGLGSDE